MKQKIFAFLLFFLACLSVSALFFFYLTQQKQKEMLLQEQERFFQLRNQSLQSSLNKENTSTESVLETPTKTSTQASETEEMVFLNDTAILLESGQETLVNFAQIEKFLKARDTHPRFLENAKTFWDTSLSVGVEPAVTFAQIALETNFMHFTGTVIPEYFNTSGLKKHEVVSDESLEAHAQFSSWEEGVLAQVEHLALYAGKKGYPLPKEKVTDTRHFPYLHGTATTVLALGKKWAPSAAYGERLMQLIHEMRTKMP